MNTVVTAVSTQAVANTAVIGKINNSQGGEYTISPSLAFFHQFKYLELLRNKPVYIKILKSVYQDIVNQLEYKMHESLGIIASTGHNTIDFFLLDDKAKSSEYHCKPDPMMNSVLQKKNGVYFVGIIHSHPPGRKTLSIPDIQYARSIIQASKNLPFILMGIACDNELFLYQVSLEIITPLTLHIVNF